MDNSAKTALRRKGPSAPAKWLEENLLKFRLNVDKLDFGSGFGADARYLDADAYDPYHGPKTLRGRYAVITCTYVLNVIESPVRRAAIVKQIREHLYPGGVAYITVRRDVKKEGQTLWGTWQGNVDVPEGDSVHKTSGFEIFSVRP